MGPIYTYRVGGGPEGEYWVLHSLDPLPDYVSIAQIRKLARIGHRRFAYWWVRFGSCGVSIDAERAGRHFARARAIGRFAHDYELEDAIEPRLPFEGEDLSDG